MTSTGLYVLAGIGILGIGLAGLITRPHLLVKVLAFNLMASVSLAWEAPTPTRCPRP